MLEDEYLSALNPSQREAVVHTKENDNALLILAGAGSGKTRVITTKIAYLISHEHYEPYSILAVTFTKKAANEMRERAELLEPLSNFAQIRTFHSWGAWFLRRYASEAGIDKNFTVYDDDDMVTLVSKAIPSVTRKEAAEIAHKISLAKDYGLTPKSSDFSAIGVFDKEVFSIQYEEYQKRLRATGNVDFGDLILLPYIVLRDNDSIRHELYRRYRVIMVDEYQDSNVAQFLLLKMLSGIDENSGIYVCVVGDDDQSIYKFRGAEVQNILRFQEQFAGTKLIRLETNYRSTQEILTCADSVVKNNGERLGKTLESYRGKGKKPTLVFLSNQNDETEFAADLIEGLAEKGVPYSEWAVLYRTNAQSLGFETEFLHRKIPYTVVGSLKFYEREEIKDALSWLEFLVNPKNEIAFRRIINKPVRGVGSTSQEKIINEAFSLEDGSSLSLLDAVLKVKLSKKAMEGAKEFYNIATELLEYLPNDLLTESIAREAMKEDESDVTGSSDENEKKLSDFIDLVSKKTGLSEYHKSQDEVSGTQREANLQELSNSASFYKYSVQGLLDFLDSIELDRNIEASSPDVTDDKVTLITLHNTKGLEFPRVIISGMEYGVFPRENKTGAELEEERRLFYVGITRAKNELYFTSCAARRLYGRTSYMQPSPFLSELGIKNIRILGNKPSMFTAESPENSFGIKESHPLAKKWCVGACVYHDDWGHGQIVRANVSPEGEYVISVSFENGGIKKFLPQYQSGSLMLEN